MGVAERTTELKSANESLRELSIRLFKMQDDKTDLHIARELHDSIGQLLAAITMNQSVISREAEKLSPAATKAFNENNVMVEEILPWHSHHLAPAPSAAARRSWSAFRSTLVCRRVRTTERGLM